MAKGIHGDYGGQSEALLYCYDGSDARTYLGFKAGTASREFFHLCRQSEVTGDLVPYQDYINGLESKPGIQVFIPAGTVHGSGRNQVVLELGTFTINAYTYKIYDYGRKGLDGRPRPIIQSLLKKHWYSIAMKTGLKKMWQLTRFYMMNNKILKNILLVGMT